MLKHFCYLIRKRNTNSRNIIIVENDNLEGYIIKADQEKAFDRLSHEYMFTVLEKFGFGDVFVKWINIFYSEINSSVKCNGFLTKYLCQWALFLIYFY
jgi:hypothetical protein